MRIFTVGFSLALGTILWLSPVLAAGLLGSIYLCVLTSKAQAYSLLFFCGLLMGAVLAVVSANRQLDRQYVFNETNNDHRIVGTVISVPKHDGVAPAFCFKLINLLIPSPKTDPKESGSAGMGSLACLHRRAINGA